MITRRTLLRAAPLLVLPKPGLARGLGAGRGGVSSAPPRLFTSLVLNSTFSYNSNYPTKYTSGDGIAPTWADDGKLYIILNDSTNNGFNGAGNGRIEIASLNGYTSSLTGTNVFGYGGALSGTPLYYYEGITAIGSTLYATITGSGQSLIVMSTDHGASWTPSPSGGTFTPMWTNHWPYSWVQYGKANTWAGPHNSDIYSYLYFWTSAGTSLPSTQVALTIGRCLLTNMPNLSAGDWSWYQGGAGMAATWGAYSTAVDVFAETTANANPLYFPTGTACYLPAFGCYSFTQSHYSDGTANSGHINFYASLFPWGPFTLVTGLDLSSPDSLFQASIAPSSVAVDGGKNVVFMTAGNYTDGSVGGKYCLHLLNCSLS